MGNKVSQKIPLWPDDPSQYHFTCWNCGKLQGLSIAGAFNRFVCQCGCGWSNRTGVDPVRARVQRINCELNLARQYGTELVDFTKPGALSSPA